MAKAAGQLVIFQHVFYTSMDRFWIAPPVSRTIVAAMFVESVLVHSGLVPGSYVIFRLSYIFKFPLPELWRTLTSFLLTGGGFSFVFDLYFSLELNSPRFSQPGDFFTYVVFCASIILFILAEAVPGDEEDYPCGTCSSVIRKTICQGLYAAWAWW